MLEWHSFTSGLYNYAELDEGNQMLKDLVEFASKALLKDLGLISVRD